MSLTSCAAVGTSLCLLPPSPPLCSHSGLNLRYQTILLSGPSGCGKMTVVESVARLCGLHVVVVSCGWVGVGGWAGLGVAGGCVQCGPFLLQCNPIGTTGVKDSVSGSITDGEYACLPPPLSSRHLPPLPPLTLPPSTSLPLPPPLPSHHLPPPPLCDVLQLKRPALVCWSSEGSTA